MATALDEIKPYVLTVGAVAALGAPAEVVVPIVRRLRSQSGVSVGPGLVNVANGIVALGVVHYVRQRPEQWQRWRRERLPRWGPITLLVHLSIAPALAAGWPRGVILRRRTPLWGLLSLTGLLQSALILVAIHRARRASSPG
jgi:hypothetical protein